MYSTSVYLFTQRQIVVTYSGNSARRYQIVYAKTLKLNKGVDNRIQFQFLDQEQKKVDISDNEITFRLISYDGSEVLLQKALSPTLPVNGLTELITTSSELEDIDPQFCSYSLEIDSGNYNLPVFVNSEAGARGAIQVVNSVLPGFVPSADITIPSHSIPNSSTETYYSSVINTSDNAILTIQPYMDGFSGTVQVQGSTEPDADWYNIGDLYTYLDESASEGYIIEGYHPYVRVKFVSTQGDVTSILAR